MKIGIHLFATRRDSRSATEILADVVSISVLADELGFDTVWLAEHHNTDWNLCTDPLTMLTHIAAHTRRIRLGTAVVNLVLHHPATIAERAILLDTLSSGRLELGIGRGFAASDYHKFGANPNVFHDHHDRLCKELTKESLGRSIPVWVATTGRPDTIEMAGRHRHGLLIASSGDKLGDVLRRARSEGIPRVAVTRSVHLGPDRTTATHEAEPYVRWYINALASLQPGSPTVKLSDVMDTFCILGNPQDCAQQIHHIGTAGATHFTAVIGIGGVPRRLVEDDLRLFARDAMPILRTSVEL